MIPTHRQTWSNSRAGLKRDQSLERSVQLLRTCLFWDHVRSRYLEQQNRPSKWCHYCIIVKILATCRCSNARRVKKVKSVSQRCKSSSQSMPASKIDSLLATGEAGPRHSLVGTDCTPKVHNVNDKLAKDLRSPDMYVSSEYVGTLVKILSSYRSRTCFTVISPWP